MRYLEIGIIFVDSALTNDLDSNRSGSEDSGLQQVSYVQNLCMKFPALRPIVLVLKKLLQPTGLNKVANDGINSYGLFLMASTFLNTCDATSMGQQLAELLNYYGNFFDPSTTSLDGTSFNPRYGFENDPMVTIDPLGPVRNLTHFSSRVAEIQLLFKKAYSIII